MEVARAMLAPHIFTPFCMWARMDQLELHLLEPGAALFGGSLVSNGQRRCKIGVCLASLASCWDWREDVVSEAMIYNDRLRDSAPAFFPAFWVAFFFGVAGPN